MKGMGNLQEGVLGDLGLGSVPTFILYANRLVRRKKSEAFRVILYFLRRGGHDE